MRHKTAADSAADRADKDTATAKSSWTLKSFIGAWTATAQIKWEKELSFLAII